MKKIIVLPLVAILLCGCSQKTATKPILNNISFVADIDYCNQKYVCDITIDDEMYITLVEPYEVKGLSLKINDSSNLDINFKGITQTIDINTLPQAAVVHQLVNLFKNASEKNINRNKENSIVSGNIDGNKYFFTFAPSGLPIMLKVDNIYLFMTFRNVVINKEI